MRNPTFISAEPEDRIIRKSDRDIREILRESDERARRLFERQEPDRPDKTLSPPENPQRTESEKANR
jgi:hypothetical protein